MRYLERNEKLIQEVRNLGRLDRGLLVGESQDNGGKTYSIGKFSSNVLERELHLALKIKDRTHYDARGASDLAVISFIAENLPELRLDIPQIHGVLRNSEDGSLIGTLTEDFSKGGKYEVNEMTFGDLTPGMNRLREILGKDKIDQEELIKIGFMVNGKARLGDFDTFLAGFGLRERSEVLNFDKMFNQVESYTADVNWSS